MSKKDDAPTDQQVIFMVGKSRGNDHDQRRTVDTATAASLVERGLARYPDSTSE